MHQAVIVSAMLVSGLALFGSAAWIQADRSAWLSVPDHEEIPIRTTISSLLDQAEIVPENPEPVTVELPPVKIFGRPPPVAQTMAATTEQVVEPCSTWEEIGPERVIDGAPVGARRVRQLCPRSLPASEPGPGATAALATAGY